MENAVVLKCTTRERGILSYKSGRAALYASNQKHRGRFHCIRMQTTDLPFFFFESTVLSSHGNIRSYDLVVGAVRPCSALFQAMTSSHGPGIHLCLDFGRSGPGAKAGRAHSSTEGELLADRLRKDLRTRHGHEVGDAPHGQVPAWRQRSELLEHPYRPGVEDGQSIQGELELLAATRLGESKAFAFTHQRLRADFDQLCLRGRSPRAVPTQTRH